MSSEFECLMNKDIYGILDGDTEIVEYQGRKYHMPYHTGSSLLEICSMFGCQETTGWSRWCYVELLIETAIEQGCVDKLLQYFFAEERFSRELQSIPLDEIDAVYRTIVDGAIGKINAILYFSKKELEQIKGHFFITNKGNTATVDLPEIKTLDLPYVHGLIERCEEDFTAENYDSVITKSRTLIEEVLIYVLERRGFDIPSSGDVVKIYCQVKKDLNLQQNKDYDNRVNSLLTGLERIIKAISEMRNTNSDAHGAGSGRIRIKGPEARLVMNSAMTFCEYIISVYDRKENP